MLERAYFPLTAPILCLLSVFGRCDKPISMPNWQQYKAANNPKLTILDLPKTLMCIITQNMPTSLPRASCESRNEPATSCCFPSPKQRNTSTQP